MRILSGIQPTGRLHIGNYFGMMKQSIQLQNEGEAYYFIANYHSLTTVHDPAEMRENVFNVAVDFLACGLDPGKATFFRQSDVPEVAELTWILSTATPMGLLERCHSYKDKEAKGITAAGAAAQEQLEPFITPGQEATQTIQNALSGGPEAADAFRQFQKSSGLENADRRFWVLACRWFLGWRETLLVVKPETALGWHRKGWRVYWR